MPLWTADDDEMLRKFYAKGETASMIAARFPDERSRNAVIGRIHRLGLTPSRNGRPRTLTQSRVMKPTRVTDGRNMHSGQAAARPTHKLCKNSIIEAPSAERLKELADKMRQELDRIEASAPPVGGIELLDLEPHHCRYPFGEPIRFCGATKVAGSSYCAEHRARCSSKVYPPLFVSERQKAA